jgi:hypothetical protein
MSDYFIIEDAEDFANAFEDSEQVYNWLIELHKEIEIEDLTEVLQLFLDMEQHENYLAVKRFISHYLNEA